MAITVIFIDLPTFLITLDSKIYNISTTKSLVIANIYAHLNTKECFISKNNIPYLSKTINLTLHHKHKKHFEDKIAIKVLFLIITKLTYSALTL